MVATAEQIVTPAFSNAADAKRYIVVGSGPTGIRFVQGLLRKNPSADITLFGNEPNLPYNRVQLSAFLAGEISHSDLALALPREEDAPNFRWIVSAITEIKKSVKQVHDAAGNRYPYDELVLAVGSRAHIPQIEGVQQAGVYTFRHLHDTESLYARVTRCRHVVIIGGGLLGLEAARAMRRFNTKITVVQQATRLMNRQLDPEASGRLMANVEELGITVRAGEGVREIIGEGRVEGVRLRSGQVLECDTVVLCAGITPNIELARNADIRIGRGIQVDDNLKTSDPFVYAIGECAEHRGNVYGLAAPGFEQAAVLADRLQGGVSSYKGSLQLSKLKVVGQAVCSMGDIVDLPSRPLQFEAVYQDKKTGAYRKVVTYRGKLLGAIAYGEWPELNRVQEAFQNQRFISRFQLAYFRLTGKLWFGEATSNVDQWANDALVCQCNGISKGQLVDVIASGALTLSAVQAETKASTVCGSCKPLVAELLGAETVQEKEKAGNSLLSIALTALAVVLTLYFMPAQTVSDSVQTQGWFEQIWNDKGWKQVSGFSLLGLSVLGLVISLRKRLKIQWLGDYAYLRVVHAVLGAFCAALLIVHTGANLGSNLNQILLIDFSGIVILGATAGAAIGISHRFKPQAAASVRKFWTWMHIIFSWPLPALLAIHILTVYYY